MNHFLFKIPLIFVVLELSLSQITLELKRKEIDYLNSLRLLQTHVPTTKFDAGFYFALSIGTPPQNFNIQLDSGSKWLWVPNKGIRTYYTNNTFDPTLSSTYKTNNTAITYKYVDTATVNGIIARDTVVIAGSTIKDFAFTLATRDGENFHVPTTPLNAIDGLIGLSYNFSAVKAQGCVCFVESLYQQGVIPNNMFSMNVGGNYRMEITLGGVNPQIVGNNQIYYYPVITGSESWDITMTGMGSSVKSISFTMAATIDSGTTAVIIPPKYQNDVIGFMPSGAVSSCYLDKDKSLTCRCDSLNLPDVFFNFATNPYIMKFKDYMSSYSSAGASCNFDFQFKDVDNAFLMGVAFLKNYYNIYDYGGRRVGFVSQTYTITGPVPTATTAPPINPTNSNPNSASYLTLHVMKFSIIIALISLLI